MPVWPVLQGISLSAHNMELYAVDVRSHLVISALERPVGHVPSATPPLL